MSPRFRLLPLPLMLLAAISAAQTAGSNNAVISLGTVQGFSDPAETPFTKSSASSYRAADPFGQDMNTTIRAMPGTFTQHDIGQGGLAVNIRGLEGLGRVNTQVDGVTQTFFQANPAHGWNGSTAYIDENFGAVLDKQS